MNLANLEQNNTKLLQATVQDLRSNLNKVVQSRDELQLANAKLQGKVQSSEKLIENLQNDLIENTKSNDELERSNIKLQAKVEATKEFVEDLNKVTESCYELAQINAKLQGNVEATKDIVDNTKTMVEDLQYELKKVTEHRKKLESEIAKLNVEEQKNK